MGFDQSLIYEVAETLGYCKQSFTTLIPAAEAGLLQSIREMQNGDS